MVVVVKKRQTRTDRKPDAAGRITRSAYRLFYEQGYGNTGLQEILEEADTARSVLYHHFQGKEELRDMYLAERIKLMQNQFLQLGSSSLETFLRRWAAFVRAEARMPAYRGCAIANLRAELPPGDVSDVQPAMQEYVALLERILADMVKDSRPDLNDRGAGALTRRLLGAYYGCLQLYKFTDDPRHLKDLWPAFSSILKSD